MITAEIRMGNDRSTNVHGNTIEEVIAKIREYHTMGNFERTYYKKKNELNKELASGWYITEPA